MTQVPAIPTGLAGPTPYLICRDADAAIGFYRRIFGATELMRLPGPDGKLMHAMLKLAEGHLMLADECPAMGALGPQGGNTAAVTLHLYVADVDATLAAAVEAGAKLTMPATDMFWGDRYGRLEDPFGHQWSLATHLRDMTADEMQLAARSAFSAN